MTYLIVKSLHLIFMVAWFAGIFYLPRLFVYHAMSEDEASNERFKIMERKLYLGIMLPSMVGTLIFGFWMLFLNTGLFSQGWIHAKLTLIVLLIGYHHYCGAIVKKFKRDANTKGHKFYRIINEVPVVMLIGIVFLAVLKPF